MSDGASRQLFPLPDLAEVPRIGSSEREAHEQAALARGSELVHEQDGSLREALFALEHELRGNGIERETRRAYEVAREYARELVRHVEQCWATAVLR